MSGVLQKGLLVFAFALCGGFVACVGPAGEPGQKGETGETGPEGEVGETGPIGETGPPGDSVTPIVPAGEGLKLKVSGAKIGADGTATIDFMLTDATGIPLDREGKRTVGAVKAEFVIAWLDADTTGAPLGYTAYTTRDNKSPTTGVTEKQYDADEGGTFAEIGFGEGKYTYTLATKIPSGFDKTKTHTVGAWATREFNGKHFTSDAVFDFVPNGDVVKTKREIVKTDACNQCHNPMNEHDRARRDVNLCMLCHNGAMKDPDSGRTLEFRSMIHSIHRGKNLPSVLAGKKYELYDASHVAEDFSDVGFPHEINNCPTCHTGAMGDVWKTKPTRFVCTSCHDTTSFESTVPAGMTKHLGGAHADDSKCTLCHDTSTSDPSIPAVHLRGVLDPTAPLLAFTIKSVVKTAPGETPVVHFTVTKSGTALDILATPLTSLTATFAGPTTDYQSFVQYKMQGTSAVGTLAAETGGFTYTFPSPVPTTAKGTYAIGLEGYIQPDTTKPELRYAARNPVAYVPVTDTAAVARRKVVDTKNCNNCHRDLSAHGGVRKSAEYCSLCHNPLKVNDQRVARLQVAETFVNSVDFKVFVHRIHMGEKLQSKPYVLGGFPAPSTTLPGGTPVTFSDVAYPGDQRACWACHVGTSYMLPLPSTVLPARTQILQCNDSPLDPTKYCTDRTVKSETPLSPAGAACTGCHDAKSTEAHVRTNALPDGTAETCVLCHGLGKLKDVQVAHTLLP